MQTMSLPSTDQTKALHDYYLELTGFQIPFTMHSHYHWEQWLLYGFTRDDLLPVVQYIKGRIRDGRRERESLLFRNLIGRPESFADDLAMAKYRPVTKTDPAREQVLREAGMSEKKEQPIRTAGDILAGLQALKQFSELKNSL